MGWWIALGVFAAVGAMIAWVAGSLSRMLDVMPDYDIEDAE